MLSVHVSIRVSVRASVFTQTLTSHSFIMIFSPNLQGMFIAMKTFCAKFWPHFEKQNSCRSQIFEIIKVF